MNFNNKHNNKPVFTKIKQFIFNKVFVHTNYETNVIRMLTRFSTKVIVAQTRRLLFVVPMPLQFVIADVVTAENKNVPKNLKFVTNLGRE